MTGAPALYGPVADDLGFVEDTLELVIRSEFKPLELMLRHVLQRSGKRLRPAIALLGGVFGDYDLDRQIPLAASIELLHTATLVHDDVIDVASTRRGLATANSQFGNAASVRLGDYMFAHAAELIARTGNVEVIRLFAMTLMTMATGELNQDISAYDTASGNLRDYYRRIDGKTASLFATAAGGGGMIARCDAATVAALRAYGHAVGMAFQIVDDILDFSGDAAELGKPVGGDLRSGTLTLPSILLVEDQPDDNPVGRLFAAEAEPERERLIEEALARIRNGDILDRSRDVARSWGQSALEALAPLPATEARTTLAAIADFVTDRTF